MFEAAELGRTVSKEEFKAREPVLLGELLEVQSQLRAAAAFPVIVVFAGVDGAGKGETVNLLNAWMDPRWIVTQAFGEPSDEELERPEYWRFWRALPPRGRIGLFLSSWYSRPVLDRVYRRLSKAEFDERLHRIVEFEQTLAADGALILKFWMHLGKAAQKKRLTHLEKDPLRRWRVDRPGLEALADVPEVHRRRGAGDPRDEPGRRAVDDRGRRGRAVPQPHGGRSDPRRDPRAPGGACAGREAARESAATAGRCGPAREGASGGVQARASRVDPVQPRHDEDGVAREGRRPACRRSRGG